MENKYTPGEWVVTQSGGLSLQVCLNDEDHTIVASVWTCNPADAHLIAAAPDLLEALEGVMEAAEFADMNQSPPGYYEDNIAAARAAIRKAYGEGV